ncbi:ATP11 protein-domain-containing protein [Chlamydoabsidia padenii]|nr:ATP11 protein-domain-containing protein [Chlamydoabsidia padenii]
MLKTLSSSLLKTCNKSPFGIVSHSARYAHVVGTPPSLFFTSSEQDRIRNIAKQANRFKIDYELKYADKIVQKARRHGVSVQQLKQQAKKTVATTPSFQQQQQQQQQQSKQGPPSSPLPSSPVKASTPKLDDFVKLDLLEKESPERIAQLWHTYHSTKENVINAVIPAHIFQTLQERGERYPMFIFPLPRPNGLEFYLLQFHQTQCYFTSLAEYKLRQDQARPFLSLTHYDELQHSKQIVLMHGHIHQPNIVTSQDAQFLAFCVQRFYGDTDLFRLVQQFHEHPQDFDHHLLIATMDKVIQ